jgi:uncharacterized membrane protein YgcG
MSSRTIPYPAPEGAGKNAHSRFPATMLGAMAGVGLLLSLPGQARADRGGFSYGHAEITLGFPNGQVTLGKTWDDDARQVVVEERPYAEDDVVHDPVIVERQYCPPPVEHVTIIDRYPEPVHVVRQVYVDRPSCERPEVVVYRRSPERVIYAPARTVIVAPRFNGGYHEGYRGEYHGEHHGYSHLYQGGNGGNGNRNDHGGKNGGQGGNGGGHSASGGGNGGGESHGYQGGSQGPPNLFPQDHGRPARARGVQHFAQR